MRRARPSLTVVTLLATAGSINVAYTALIPLVPLLRREMGASLAVIGLSFTVFALARGLAQLLGGYLADRLPARLVAVGALVLAGAAIAGFAFAGSGTELVAWRGLWGAAEGVLTPALYRLGVLVATERGIEQGRLMGWFGSAAVGGMAAGPALVGVMGSVLSFRAIFLIAAAVTLATAALAAVALRVDERSAARSLDAAAAARTPQRGGAGLRSMLLPIVLFGGIDLVNNGLYAALEPLLPLTIEAQLGGGVGPTALLFSWGLVVFAVVAAAGGGLVERMRPLTFAGALFAGIAVAMGVIGVARGYVVLALGFTAFMALHPLLYVAARRGLSERCAGRATAFGYFGAVSDLGFVLGPALGTLLLARIGAWVYAVLGAIALLAAAAYLVGGRAIQARWSGEAAPRDEPAGRPAASRRASVA